MMAGVLFFCPLRQHFIVVCEPYRVTKREKPDETAVTVNNQQGFLGAAIGSDKSLDHFPQSLIEPLLLLTSLIDVTVYTDS